MFILGRGLHMIAKRARAVWRESSGSKPTSRPCKKRPRPRWPELTISRRSGRRGYRRNSRTPERVENHIYPAQDRRDLDDPWIGGHDVGYDENPPAGGLKDSAKQLSRTPQTTGRGFHLPYVIALNLEDHNYVARFLRSIRSNWSIGNDGTRKPAIPTQSQFDDRY